GTGQCGVTDPTLEMRAVSLTEFLAERPPSREAIPLRHDLAVLRVARLEDVLPTRDRLRAERPDLAASVGSPTAIEQFQTAQSLARGAAAVLLLRLGGLNPDCCFVAAWLLAGQAHTRSAEMRLLPAFLEQVPRQQPRRTADGNNPPRRPLR